RAHAPPVVLPDPGLHFFGRVKSGQMALPRLPRVPARLPVKSFTHFDASSRPSAETEYHLRLGFGAVACSIVPSRSFATCSASFFLSSGRREMISRTSRSRASSSVFRSPAGCWLIVLVQFVSVWPTCPETVLLMMLMFVTCLSPAT